MLFQLYRSTNTNLNTLPVLFIIFSIKCFIAPVLIFILNDWAGGT